MDAKKQKWHQVIEHRFNKTELALQKITRDFTGDHIHDFRVEIKKLKAVIRLISYNVPDPVVCKFPKPLNKLYKALGSLREWQIQKTNIVQASGEMHFAIPTNYMHKINLKTFADQRRVMELIQKLPDMKKMKDQIKSNGPDELSPASIIRFIQTKIHAVQVVVKSGKEDDESMHDMRKKIKDIQYVLSGIAKTGEIDEQSSPLESVQEVSGQLGDYHDLCTSLALLKKELQISNTETGEKKMLRKIKESWQAEKLKLRKQTIRSTKALIGLHFSDAVLN